MHTAGKRDSGRWLLAWAVSLVAMLAYLQLIGYPEARRRMGSTGLAPEGGVGLFPPWYATQQLLQQGRDPYAADIAQEVQVRIYGGAAGDTSLTQDEHRFAYPLHVIFLVAPTVWLPFAAAQWVWFALLLAATIASVPWWLRGMGLHPPAPRLTVAIVALLGALAIQQGLHLQQIGLLIAALLAGALAAAAAGRYTLAGVLLAIATAKPHVAAAVTLWMFLWSLGDLPRRRALLIGFGSTLAAMLGLATMLMPGWLPRWVAVVSAYPSYTGARPLLVGIFGSAGPYVAAAATAALILYWWRNRRLQPGTSGFRSVVVLTLAAQMMLLPTWIGHNQVLLVPIALVAALEWARLRETSSGMRLALIGAAAAVLWERLAAAALVAAHAGGVLQAPVPAVVALPIYPLFLYPLFALAFALAYSINWRAASRRDEVVVASVR